MRRISGEGGNGEGGAEEGGNEGPFMRGAHLRPQRRQHGREGKSNPPHRRRVVAADAVEVHLPVAQRRGGQRGSEARIQLGRRRPPVGRRTERRLEVGRHAALGLAEGGVRRRDGGDHRIVARAAHVPLVARVCDGRQPVVAVQRDALARDAKGDAQVDVLATGGLRVPPVVSEGRVGVHALARLDGDRRVAERADEPAHRHLRVHLRRRRVRARRHRGQPLAVKVVGARLLGRRDARVRLGSLLRLVRGVGVAEGGEARLEGRAERAHARLEGGRVPAMEGRGEVSGRSAEAVEGSSHASKAAAYSACSSVSKGATCRMRASHAA